MSQSIRTLAFGAAMLALVAWLAPGLAVAADQPPDAAADEAARQLALAPFAGNWGRHGYSLAIQANGDGEARWRVYEVCERPGVKPPCDSFAGDEIQPGGHAVIQLATVDGQTAYGSLVDISDTAHPVFRSASLTLRPSGTARLRSGSDAEVRTPVLDVPDGSPRYGTTLCRADAWQTDVCGA